MWKLKVYKAIDLVNFLGFQKHEVDTCLVAVVGRCIPEIKTEFFEKLQSYNVTVNSSELEDGRDYLAIFLNAQEYGMKILQDVRASWHMCLV